MPKLFVASALTLAIAAACASAAPAHAYDLNSPSELNVDNAGVAIRGYDPVAYFTDAAPTPGDARFSASYGGATYHFASAEHLGMFQQNPEKYIPAFGGFCAMGAAGERKADGDPLLWKIVDGRLYLNVNRAVNKMWLDDVPGNIAKATTNWSHIKDETPKHLFDLHPLN